MAYPSRIGSATRRTPRMDRQIERILAVLEESALTEVQMAEKLFISRHTAGRYIHLMYSEKMIHISGHEENPRNKPARIFSAGDKPDVKYIPGRKRPRNVGLSKQIKKDRILALLVLPQSAKQLLTRSGMSLSRVRDLIAELRVEGKVYIHGYLDPIIKGSYTPIYAAGSQPDCVFTPLTRSEKNRRVVLKTKRANELTVAPKVFAALVASAQKTYPAWEPSMMNIPEMSEA